MNTLPQSKNILCYGDSYTWGYVPATGHQRLSSNKRWTGILQIELGENYNIIEEGLNSRTLHSDDTRPGKEGRNGKTYLIPCLDTHDPIDIVILMLGTNELKDRFNTNLEEIIDSLENNYINVILKRKSQFMDKTPKLVLMSPPVLNLDIKYANDRYSKSRDKNIKLANNIKKLADKYKCGFIKTEDIVELGEDGVHFGQESHRKLGEHIANYIRDNY